MSDAASLTESDDMAARKLNVEQQTVLFEYLVAGYQATLIQARFKDRGWPVIRRQSIQHYRDQCRDEIEAATRMRHESALNSGLALKEERVARLAEYADDMDAIKWVTDEKGRLWNGKEWREALDDIAKELGHRKASPDAETANTPTDELRSRVRAVLAEVVKESASGGVGIPEAGGESTEPAADEDLASE